MNTSWFRTRSLKRAASLVIASSTIVMGVGAIAPVAAHAQGTTAACSFQGATTSISPYIGAVGGSGTFSFSGTIKCAVSDGSVESGDITVTNGTYTNTVCGTGTASGTADLSAGMSGSVTFSITFAAGEGSGSASGTISGSNGSVSGGFTIAVNIVPTGGDCATGVSQFTANGTVTNA